MISAVLAEAERERPRSLDERLIDAKAAVTAAEHSLLLMGQDEVRSAEIVRLEEVLRVAHTSRVNANVAHNEAWVTIRARYLKPGVSGSIPTEEVLTYIERESGLTWSEAQGITRVNGPRRNDEFSTTGYPHRAGHVFTSIAFAMADRERASDGEFLLLRRAQQDADTAAWDAEKALRDYRNGPQEVLEMVLSTARKTLSLVEFEIERRKSRIAPDPVVQERARSERALAKRITAARPKLWDLYVGGEL
jgi:hypothetical protein